MDSSTTAPRGRGRASTRKRSTHGAPPSHPPSTTAAATAATSTTSTPTDDEPVNAASSVSSAGTVPSSDFNFEVSSPTASRSTHGRARVAEATIPSSDDPDSKSGRSLRKRARVDYTFDQSDGNMSDGGKPAPSSTRAPKRRRTESALHGNDEDGDYEDVSMQRRSSEHLPHSPLLTPRTRNRVQKAAAHLSSDVPAHSVENGDVYDTIEVGGQQSPHSATSTRKRGNSDTGHDYPHYRKRIRPWTPLNNHSHSNDVNGDAKLQEKVQSPSPDIREEPTSDGAVSNPYAHLTPYIENVMVKWPFGQEEDEPAQHDAMEEPADDQPDGQLGLTDADNELEDSLLPDPLVPTESPEEDIVDEETPVISPLPVDATVDSPAADAEPVEPAYIGKKPKMFKKTRDAAAFAGLFDNLESLSTLELYQRLEIANKAMVAWQNEYNELRKLTDDERNAARYRKYVASYEQRLKMHASKHPNGNPPKQQEFVLTGIRAKRASPEVLYAQEQDKIMAANYEFEYDGNRVGFQDPLNQKPGGRGRLRDRPRQTAKAAEADDGVVIHGKRTRKPPVLYDGSEAASARTTPVPVQRRRRKTAKATEDNGEVKEETKQPEQGVMAAPPTEAAPPKKKGKGGRPRKHPLPAPISEPAPATPASDALVSELETKPEMPTDTVPSKEAEPEVKQEAPPSEPKKPARKGRRAKAAPKAPVVVEEATPASNGFDKPAPVTSRARRTDSNLSEVPSSTFYSSTLPSTTAAEDSRPPTSSSTTTQSTVSSNYQLREKRQRVFTLEPSEEGYVEAPKPKRARRTKKTPSKTPKAKAAESAAAVPPPPPTPTSLAAHKATSEPGSASKPAPKIKLKNYAANVAAPPPSAAAANGNPFAVPTTPTSLSSSTNNNTTNGAVTNGTDTVGNKDYSQMTKSEKMSQSMKARWASGSMFQAVEKRRVTLANKKQAVGKPVEATPAVDAPPAAPKQ